MHPAVLVALAAVSASAEWQWATSSSSIECERVLYTPDNECRGDPKPLTNDVCNSHDLLAKMTFETDIIFKNFPARMPLDPPIHSISTLGSNNAFAAATSSVNATMYAWANENNWSLTTIRNFQRILVRQDNVVLGFYSIDSLLPWEITRHTYYKIVFGVMRSTDTGAEMAHITINTTGTLSESTDWPGDKINMARNAMQSYMLPFLKEQLMELEHRFKC